MQLPTIMDICREKEKEREEEREKREREGRGERERERKNGREGKRERRSVGGCTGLPWPLNNV